MSGTIRHPVAAATVICTMLAVGALPRTALAAPEASRQVVQVCVETSVRSWRQARRDRRPRRRPPEARGSAGTLGPSPTAKPAGSRRQENGDRSSTPTSPSDERSESSATGTDTAAERPATGTDGAPTGADPFDDEFEATTGAHPASTVVRPRPATPLPPPQATPRAVRTTTRSPFVPVRRIVMTPAADPAAHLRRLVEYQVTHQRGFEAVREGCSERLVVELYPIEGGYTVFARYSGTAREEKVDRVQTDEFGALAYRLAVALLRDVPIEETLTRRTVLRADSESEVRRVEGDTQFLFAIGSLLLGGRLPTAPNPTDPAEERVRLLTPLSAQIGARTAFGAWALDAYGGVTIGTQYRSTVRARGGGHADYTVGLDLALHFLRYFDADAINGFYGGGGATFQLHGFRILPAEDSRRGEEGVFGGGMSVDAVLGYEVMRTSALHFFIEGQLLLPTYVYQSENANGDVTSWMPGLLLQIGLLH